MERGKRGRCKRKRNKRCWRSIRRRGQYKKKTQRNRRSIRRREQVVEKEDVIEEEAGVEEDGREDVEEVIVEEKKDKQVE